MEEDFDELLEKNNCIAFFPCLESATRFAFYISERGYKSQIGEYDIEKWPGYYKVIYWKEDPNESED